MSKKGNAANRQVTDKASYITGIIRAEGVDGIEENYLIALLHVDGGIDPRKSQLYLKNLLLLKRIRKEEREKPKPGTSGDSASSTTTETYYYINNLTALEESPQVDLQGNPSDEEGSVLDIIARARARTQSKEGSA